MGRVWGALLGLLLTSAGARAATNALEAYQEQRQIMVSTIDANLEKLVQDLADKSSIQGHAKPFGPFTVLGSGHFSGSVGYGYTQFPDFSPVNPSGVPDNYLAAMPALAARGAMGQLRLGVPHGALLAADIGVSLFATTEADNKVEAYGFGPRFEVARWGPFHVDVQASANFARYHFQRGVHSPGQDYSMVPGYVAKTNYAPSSDVVQTVDGSLQELAMGSSLRWEHEIIQLKVGASQSLVSGEWESNSRDKDTMMVTGPGSPSAYVGALGINERAKASVSTNDLRLHAGLQIGRRGFIMFGEYEFSVRAVTGGASGGMGLLF